MRIEIKYDGKKYLVRLHQTGVRGYRGLLSFSNCTEARLAAEGIRFCYLNNRVSVSCDYSDKESILSNIHRNNKAFKQGMEVFYVKVLNTSQEVCDKAIASILQ